MTIVSLGSGSCGNSYCVGDGDSWLMIDCGVRYKELCKRAAQAGVDLTHLVGIVFTHDHTDHTIGIEVFHKHFPDIPLFANFMTAEAISSSVNVDISEFFTFENGQAFKVGRFAVEPFSIPHDVPDPVAFLVRANGFTYFHATDVGTPLDFIGTKLREADAATLESDYDCGLLAASERPESLKRRIRGSRGHLSNDDAAELVRRFASPRLRYLALGHLSGECNEPHLAENTMRDALAAMSRTDIELEVLPRDGISKGFRNA